MSLATIFNAMVPVVWGVLAWRLWRSDRRDRQTIARAQAIIDAYDNTHRAAFAERIPQLQGLSVTRGARAADEALAHEAERLADLDEAHRRKGS